MNSLRPKIRTKSSSYLTANISVYISKTKCLMLYCFMEMIAVYYEIHKKHANKLCGRELRTLLVLENLVCIVTTVV